MSILERPASPQAPAAGSKPRDGRLRVITAGRVGNMEARLGTSGFDIVAAAETEDALIDAVSSDEADAIVVEADLCDSLEHVRDLAPDALLIVIGDHTPAGALGRIEPGVSGTVMSGLLHALVAEGIGGAVGWGLVPALGPRGVLHVPQRISGWMLSAKADLVRESVANAFRDHAELVTAASTVAVTVSASVVLAVGAARTNERPHERPEHVHVPALAVERAPQYPAVDVSPTTQTPAYGPSGDEGDPGERRGPIYGESKDHDRYDDQIGDQGADDQVGDEGNDDQVGDQGADDQGEGEDKEEDEGADDQGEGEDKEEDEGADDQGEGEDKEEDEGADDQGEGEGEGEDKDKDKDKDKDEGNDDQGEDEGNDDQGEDEGNDDQGEDEGNDDQGEDEGNDDQGEDEGTDGQVELLGFR